MIQTVLLSLILLLSLATAVGRYFEQKEMKKLAGPIMDKQEKVANQFLKVFQDLEKNTTEMNTIVRSFNEEPLPPPVDATRVYAGIFNAEHRHHLFMAPAKTFDDFTAHSMFSMPAGAVAEEILFVDVLPRTTEKMVERAPTITEKKEMNIEQGAYFLQMVRDRFAKGRQRMTMDAVIKNYKESYELS